MAAAQQRCGYAKEEKVAEVAERDEGERKCQRRRAGKTQVEEGDRRRRAVEHSVHLLAWCPIAFSLGEPHWDGNYQRRKSCGGKPDGCYWRDGEDKDQMWPVDWRPTPAETQETLAYDAVPEASRHRHVRLPRLRQNPAERGQEEEMKERCDHGAQDLEQQRDSGGRGRGEEEDQGNRIMDGRAQRDSTLFQVWVCPMRIRALDEMMERQKLMRMTERSDRMYLQQRWTKDSWWHEWNHHLPALGTNTANMFWGCWWVMVHTAWSTWREHDRQSFASSLCWTTGKGGRRVPTPVAWGSPDRTQVLTRSCGSGDPDVNLPTFSREVQLKLNGI